MNFVIRKPPSGDPAGGTPGYFWTVGPDGKSVTLVPPAVVGGVTSWDGRVGAVVPLANDYAASQVTNDSSVAGVGVKGALNTLLALVAGAGVSSWNARVGAVVPAANDYAASQVTNDSSVAGVGVKGALNTLLAQIAALVTGVSSFNTRAGAVVPATNDYAASQVSNDSSVAGTGVKGALNTLLAMAGVTSFNSRTGAVLPAAADYTTTLVSNLSSVLAATGTDTDALNALYAVSNANPTVQAVPAWFVDFVNGSDANNGQSAGAGGAFKTASKLASLLCPGGAQYQLTQNVTLNFAGTATYPELNLNVGTNENAATVFTLKIVCAITSTANILLSAVAQPNSLTLTRGELTTLAGTFVSKSRIRLTSGASSGAIAYSTGLHAGVLNTYVSGFCDPLSLAARSANVNDNCVVDTLTVTFSRIRIQCSGNAQVIVQDAKIVRAQVGGVALDIVAGVGNAGGNVAFSGCAQTGGAASWENTSGGATMLACVTSGANTQLEGPNWLIAGHVCQGNLKLGDGSMLTFGITLDGGTLTIGTGAGTGLGVSGPSKWVASPSTAVGCGLLEAENGTGGATAITLAPGGSSIELFPGGAADIVWGASAVYGIGWIVSPNSYVQLVSVSTTNFLSVFALPSTVNFQVAGHNYAYSVNQICEPNSNCGVIAANFGGVNLADGPPVYSKAQAGNIGATSTGLSQPGLYRLSGYVACTTADATATGAPVLNGIWTDDSGVAQTVQIATTLLTALGGAGGALQVETNGAAIQWSVTGIVAANAARYSVRVRSTLISSGA